MLILFNQFRSFLFSLLSWIEYIYVCLKDRERKRKMVEDSLFSLEIVGLKIRWCNESNRVSGVILENWIAYVFLFLFGIME